MKSDGSPKGDRGGSISPCAGTLSPGAEGPTGEGGGESTTGIVDVVPNCIRFGVVGDDPWKSFFPKEYAAAPYPEIDVAFLIYCAAVLPADP